MKETWSKEVGQGSRFRFGANWENFLALLDNSRIEQAKESVCSLLGLTDLTGKRFLDIGSGSGLFSLAARLLGAEVTSLDYDPDSVACTQRLRRSFRPEDAGWTVLRGSVLDETFMAGLGSFDIVYSWGVLHHTGSLHGAMDIAARSVAPGGLLALALYNHQPFFTPLHTRLKRLYAHSPTLGKRLIALAYALGVGSALFAADLLRGRNPLARHTGAGLPRGMNFWHDVVDWVGGYPFETITPDEVFRFHKARGFQLTELRTVGGKSGCNEFTFTRLALQRSEPCASS
jgi:2-polyprenyl-6-hydroxyphenyl methylase/3-demethylubiquinone-9 3-methyltransferase